MSPLSEFLSQYGTLMVCLAVFAEQIGLPIPSTVVLLAAGAAVGTGELQAGGVFLLAVIGAVAADLIWYGIGRAKGLPVLGLLCRVSLEPDTCIRRTEERFARNRRTTILLAKFLPGLSTAAPPLAGMFRMNLARFLFYDVLGAALWVGTFGILGYVFSSQLELVLRWIHHLGIGLGLLAVLVVAGFAGWRYLQRVRLLRELRVSTVSPEDLHQRIQAGERPVVIDVRHQLERTTHPVRIPGALALEADALEQGRVPVPSDQEIILYCT